jgi:cystathionine gamma-synthase
MGEEDGSRHTATRFVHAGRGALQDPADGVSVPVYRSAVFRHRGFGQDDRYTYARLGNPTRVALEEAVAELSGGVRGFAFASGMAALAAAFSVVEAGGRLLASSDLYGHTYRLLVDHLAQRGVEVRFVDTWDAQALRAAFAGGGVHALFLETPTNPLMHITDLRAATDLAHAHGALVIVDNTFLTPYGQRPLVLGADIVVESATKYLAGHNDVLAGVLAVREPALGERIATYQVLHGAPLGPDDSWLVLRGLKTLPLRLERQAENALTLARYLADHPLVERVLYPGLPDHPGYDVHARQADTAGATLAFEVRSMMVVAEVLSRVRLISYAESLGGVESLITHPAGQTHRDIPPAERRARGISDRLLRLSVGIEDVRDLEADLAAALVEP